MPRDQPSLSPMSQSESMLSNQNHITHDNASHLSISMSSPLVNPNTKVNETTIIQTPPTESLSPLIQNSTTHSIQPHNAHHMLTRAKISHFKPKMILSHVKPTSVKQSIAHLD